jgi:hypothetical protein
VIAIALGYPPSAIGAPAVLVAVVIGVTVPEYSPSPMTYTVFPSGVIASPAGNPLTAIGAPAMPVAVVIGVTVPEPEFAT